MQENQKKKQKAQRKREEVSAVSNTTEWSREPLERERESLRNARTSRGADRKASPREENTERP